MSPKVFLPVIRAPEKKNCPILLVLRPGCCVAPSGEYTGYSPLEAPCIRAEIRRNMGQFFFSVTLILLLILSTSACSGISDDLFKYVTEGAQSGPTEATIISGLKEALSIGTQNAVSVVSKRDGYFANESIKILMPAKFQQVATVLENLGFGQQVDDFVLSMNRAAERAAPKATACLVDAITQMSFEDAKNILNGGETAATDYFRLKASDELYRVFEPMVASAMNEVGVTRNYRQIVDRYEAIPFMTIQPLDLDAYVTNGALDGLFHMVAQEEKKIRTDPAARVTELLKTVFGK